ncbi:putative TATA-box binding protein associated factor 12 superfamily protein [Tetraselmis virus 1]|uniref:Putative TATA-box binding protein associated factor 12 superfamily protein n=1 Tax=Tetraselmis virus 1 TaxID=2060617 RepID=A0A2P0VMR6_9VIRU|nr:putative TATA-box binding protein associated factor 12 superfamily protein [Tetraselmis virus 1]AUF82186.1 putative TATA-box binding protein associated factor 12 superfamily protein [Tetraselmis virus 1]
MDHEKIRLEAEKTQMQLTKLKKGKEPVEEKIPIISESTLITLLAEIHPEGSTIPSMDPELVTALQDHVEGVLENIVTSACQLAKQYNRTELTKKDVEFMANKITGNDVRPAKRMKTDVLKRYRFDGASTSSST